MINELERIWKKTVVGSMRYYPNISMEELKKTTSNLSQDSQSPG
jgi:hypothetical protein